MPARKAKTVTKPTRCDVCINGKITCAEGTIIGEKICIFCGGTGLAK